MSLVEANYNLEPDNSSQIIETAEKYNLDTREKLEADVKAHAQGEAPEKPEYTDLRLVRVPVDTVLSWLDRQAAITKHENDWEFHREVLVRENCEQAERIAELTTTCDALRAKLETYGKVPDQDECKKQQPMESGDTREKLNEELMDSCLTFADHGGHLRAFSYVSELLDRQAAITIRECTSEGESCCEACRAAQKRKIAELTAERDQLSRDLDAEHALCLQFEEDNERLKKANRIQAESFRKLEVELTKMKDADDE